MISDKSWTFFAETESKIKEIEQLFKGFWIKMPFSTRNFLFKDQMTQISIIWAEFFRQRIDLKPRKRERLFLFRNIDLAKHSSFPNWFTAETLWKYKVFFQSLNFILDWEKFQTGKSKTSRKNRLLENYKK